MVNLKIMEKKVKQTFLTNDSSFELMGFQNAQGKPPTEQIKLRKSQVKID